MQSSSIYQPVVSWWVEVYTSAPPQTYHLGPFGSREEAKVTRGTHVDALYQQEARDIVALVKQQ